MLSPDSSVSLGAYAAHAQQILTSCVVPDNIFFAAYVNEYAASNRYVPGSGPGVTLLRD